MSQSSAHSEFFQELERRMLALSPPTQLGITRDRWLLVAVAFGSGLALIPLQRLIVPEVAAWLTLGGLVLQLTGAILLAYRQVLDVLPELQDAKRKFAVDLDQHFVARDHVLAWLRTLSSEIRQSRMRYVSARLASIRSRYTIAFGAVDKLGLLPVLVGLFVQAQGITALSWPAKLLGLSIIVLYLMSLWIVRYRTQLEGYERVLQAVEQEGAPKREHSSQSIKFVGVN